MKKYTIKPLEWVYTERHDYEAYTAETANFGSLIVRRNAFLVEWSRKREPTRE